MATTNTNDNPEVEKEAHENDAFEGNKSETKNIGNGLAAGAIALTIGAKWSHLTKTRRLTRQNSGRPSDFVPNINVTGLEEDRDDASQARLNKQLISHFVSLAKQNDTDDEVNLDLIDDLVKKGADVNCRDKHGQGLLHEAARAWHTDIVIFLLDHGADINMPDRLKRTPLHVAAAVDYPEMVELLIERGADIEATTEGELQTPLHFAARNDASESLKILCKLGAEIEATDYKNRTPIFVAAELDRSETAKFLIEMNADVTVVDTSGQMCMTHMITKMGPVARTALDQYHKKDRANRKQYFFLDLLAVPLLNFDGKTKRSLAKTPLEVIVNYRQLDLIMHPVIMRLIDVKWNLFGRRVALRTLFINLLFVLTWTILGVGYPWYLRTQYIFPEAGWRVFLWIVGCLFACYEVFGEVKEIVRSRKKFRKWKAWREKQIDDDMRYCHPKWPEEQKYLEREKELLDEALPTYFQDFWNYFDWVVYFSVFLVVILHIADVALTNPATPCCTTELVCVDPDPNLCQSGIVNNSSLSVWSNRFFVLLILFLWLRLMKFTRAFRFLGPFIVMLGKLTTDIVRFLYLYLEFYIPYSCAFWMVFGGISTISSMQTVDQMLFSLFRITLVDDYQFQEMQTYDIVMAYILIGTFLGISAILCLNLFIALLSDTFQRVYDNANANAVMQQAALLLSFEDNLSKSTKKKARKYIHEKCNPESMYYDDDLTVEQDADLKKVTIQIKEQMDDLMEYISKAEKDKMHEEFEDLTVSDEKPFGTQRNPRNQDNFISPRPEKLKAKTSSRFTDVLGLAQTANAQKGTLANDAPGPPSKNKISDLTERLQRLQISQTVQEQANKKLRNDVKEIKEMLSQLLPGGGPTAPKRGGLNLFSPPTMSLSSVTEEMTQRQKSETQESSKGSNMFKRLLGTQKSEKTSPRPDEVVPLPHFVPSPMQPPTTTSSSSGLRSEVIPIEGSFGARSDSTVYPAADSSNV